MKSHNKCLLAVALVATKAAVGEGAARLSMGLCQLMELLFQRVKKYSGTAKPPLFQLLWGSPKWTPPTPPFLPPGHPSHITSIMHECQ